jgi:hypothetical protein
MCSHPLSQSAGTSREHQKQSPMKKVEKYKKMMPAVGNPQESIVAENDF